jgi:type I restriction enzyme S subunit
MVVFRPHQGISATYLLAVLNGPIGRKQAERAATGTAHPHINLRAIREYAIPVAPSDEQLEIVNRLESVMSEVNEVERAVRSSELRVAGLRQSVLTAAFSGDLIDGGGRIRGRKDA